MTGCSFELNGHGVMIDVADTRRVIDLLREDLKLTGTKEGCGTGECGACTIVVEGETRLSCLLLAAQINGRKLMTVEGLAATPLGARLQQACVEMGAVQCGYCIPGMEMAAFVALAGQPGLAREAIRVALSGNLCRCTGYVKIIDALERAAVEGPQ